jgi:hypothetical protein
MNPAWAPDRFRFGIGKLIAYFLARRPATDRRLPEVLHWQKDQNAVGTIGASIVYFALWTSLCVELLAAASGRVHFIWIVLLALLATSNFSLLTVLCFPVADALAGERRNEPTRGNDVSSRVLNVLFTAASLLAVWNGGPGSRTARMWLGIVAINALAAFIVRVVLRKEIDELNRRLRSVPSGL